MKRPKAMLRRPRPKRLAETGSGMGVLPEGHAVCAVLFLGFQEIGVTLLIEVAAVEAESPTQFAGHAEASAPAAAITIEQRVTFLDGHKREGDEGRVRLYGFEHLDHIAVALGAFRGAGALFAPAFLGSLL